MASLPESDPTNLIPNPPEAILSKPPSNTATTTTTNPGFESLHSPIEAQIERHPLTKALRSNPTLTETRPHLSVPSTLRASNLMTGPLSGSERIPIAPYIWTDNHGQSLTMILHLGSNLCGHPGIVHGGLLATLLDEGLARCCFAALPGKVGVTANLNVDFRKPAVVDALYCLVAETVRLDGRKAWVEGRIERLALDGDGDGDGKGEVVVEARALFIEPRSAESLKGLYNLPG